MIFFTDHAIIVREICNGVMFVSSIVLISLFAAYVAKNIMAYPGYWYRDIAVQAALAVIILMIGHSIRAGASWLEFVWLHAGLLQPWWANAVEIFIIATAITVLGEALMILAFATIKWRCRLLLFLGIVSILIPAIVAISI